MRLAVGHLYRAINPSLAAEMEEWTFQIVAKVDGGDSGPFFIGIRLGAEGSNALSMFDVFGAEIETSVVPDEPYTLIRKVRRTLLPYQVVTS